MCGPEFVLPVHTVVLGAHGNSDFALVYMLQVSAIRGACPAGGCCLSLCCDFRIMTDFGHIGLNEVRLPL